MCTHVRVSGIPTYVKLGKLIPLFSNILSLRSSDFLMRILSSNGTVKEVLLSLHTLSEAQLAQEKLDNFVYKHNNVSYIFTASIDGGYKRNNKKPNPRSRFPNQNMRRSYDHQYGNQYVEGYQQDRSRSPHYKETSSQLDMQIEILRKQRMILEEERKLLEEQRKLDQLKMKSLSHETSSVVNRTYGEDVEMSGQTSNTFEKKQLTFHQASGVLLRKMNMFIDRHSSKGDRKALVMQLRSILKQRLGAVVAADGRGVYQTHKVIMLYRSQHPPSDDEKLVKETLKDVREGRCITNTKTVKASAKGANVQSKPDGTKSVAGDHTLQEGSASTKDTTLSGDSNYAENIEDESNQKIERKFQEKRLFFHKASAALIRKMDVHMNKYSLLDTRRLLVEYLRNTLKQRLATLVAGQPIYQTHKIIKLYRAHHPVTEDEDFIKQLVKDIDEGRVPDEIIMKDKQAKLDTGHEEVKSAAIDNNSSQDNIITGEESTNEPDQPDNNEGTVSENTDNTVNIKKCIDDASENTDNTVNIKKCIDDASENTDYTVIIKKCIDDAEEDLENENNEDNVNFNVKNKCDEKIDTKSIDDSHSDLVTDNTDKDTSSFNIQKNVDKEADDAQTAEDTQKYFDSGIKNEDNRGVKRKNEEIDDGPIIEAKTDGIAENDSWDTNGNEREDWY